MGLLNTITKKIATALFQQMGFPFYNGNAPIITNEPYNGEKNAGKLGAVKNYIPDFQTLSARSWQAYTEIEIAQLIIHNFLLWTIGTLAGMILHWYLVRDRNHKKNASSKEAFFL